MYIQIPFLNDAALDTANAWGVTDGPSIIEIEALIEELERGNVPSVRFMTPGEGFDLHLEQIRPHPTLIDTWWFQGITEDQQAMEIYVLWSPVNSRSNYLASLVDTIDTHGWR